MKKNSRIPESQNNYYEALITKIYIGKITWSFQVGMSRWYESTELIPQLREFTIISFFDMLTNNSELLTITFNSVK